MQAGVAFAVEVCHDEMVNFTHHMRNVRHVCLKCEVLKCSGSIRTRRYAPSQRDSLLARASLLVWSVLRMEGVMPSVLHDFRLHLWPTMINANHIADTRYASTAHCSYMPPWHDRYRTSCSYRSMHGVPFSKVSQKHVPQSCFGSEIRPPMRMQIGHDIPDVVATTR